MEYFENQLRKMDWRIKDKIYVIVNILNKRRAKKGKIYEPIETKEVINKMKYIMKKEKLSELDSLKIIINYLYDNLNEINIDNIN